MKELHNGKGLIIGVEEVNGKTLEQFPDLKVIGVPMTGLDHLPWKEIKKRDIKVISLKDHPLFLSTITSTAEHTIGLIIALLRNYKTALNAPYQDREAYKGHTLSGKTLGVIGGQGRIGKQVRGIMEDFGMNVLWLDKVGNYITLEELLKQSDVVTVHIPLPGNEGFFTKGHFALMKPTAYFVNTSRLGVVAQGALKWALENKIIAGAAVDFIDDQELLEYSKVNNNLILTNHIAGNTFEDRELTQRFIENLVENYLTDNKLI